MAEISGLRDFLKPIELVNRVLKPEAERMKRIILENAVVQSENRPLSMYTRQVHNRVFPATVRLSTTPMVGIKKNSVFVGFPKGGSTAKQMIHFKGRKGPIKSMKQTMKLRRLGVEGGLFGARVLRLSASRPPFAMGRTIIQPGRNPAYRFNATLNKPANDLFDTVLKKTWGFS